MPRSSSEECASLLQQAQELLALVEKRHNFVKRDVLIGQLISCVWTLRTFAAIYEGYHEAESHLADAAKLCKRLVSCIEGSESDAIGPLVNTTIHMVATCRMLTLVQVFWRLLHNMSASPLIVDGFEKAVKDLRTSLEGIIKLETAERIEIRAPYPSLYQECSKMLNKAIKADKEPKLYTPREILPAHQLQVYENIKSGFVSDNLLEKLLEGSIFLVIPRGYLPIEDIILADLEFSSANSSLGAHLITALPSKGREGVLELHLPISDVGPTDHSSFVNYMCPICLEEGDKLEQLFCGHCFHEACIWPYFSEKRLMVCPLCGKRN